MGAQWAAWPPAMIAGRRCRPQSCCGRKRPQDGTDLRRDGCSTSGCSPVRWRCAAWAAACIAAGVRKLGRPHNARAPCRGHGRLRQFPAWHAPPGGARTAPAMSWRGQEWRRRGRETKSISPKADALHPGVGCDLKSVLHRRGRLDQHVQRHMGGAARASSARSASEHVVDRFHLGHHDVAQAVAQPRRQWWRHRLQMRGGPSRARALPPGQSGRQPCQRKPPALACATSLPHRGTVFAIEGHIQHASAKLCGHLGLQSAGSCACELPHRCSDRTRAMPVHRAWAPSSISRGWSGPSSATGLGNAQGEKKSGGHCKLKARATACCTALKLRAASACLARAGGRKPSNRPPQSASDCVLYSRCLTPSFSPSSSARVLLMHSCDECVDWPDLQRSCTRRLRR